MLKNALTEIVYVIPKYSILNETNVSAYTVLINVKRTPLYILLCMYLQVPLVCVPLGMEGEGRTRTAIRVLPKEVCTP